jgi:2-oxoglutarate dehydrogenase E2 component (dihydrolipoamide succinyltransferase)
MKYEIKIPAMGESITEATIGTILKPSGSSVNVDDELLELETDKVNQVLYAPQPGVVTYSVSPEEKVAIGQIIGYIDSAAAPTAEPKTREPEKAAPKAIPTPSGEEGARKLKEEFLAEVHSKEAPTVKVTPPPTAQPAAPSQVMTEPGERRETRTKMSKIRKVIASRLVEAQRTTAMLTTFNEADLTEVIALREKYKESFQKRYGAKLGFMSFFVKASVLALKEFPEINSYIDGEDIVHREYYNIGIAVGTERGLIVPVIKDCDHLSFAQIESAIETFAKKAREGTITVNDLQGGGFTITNGGIYGSLLSTPILNPPQSAILGMHKILKRPVAIDDQVVIRPMMYLALSYDHRIVDGKDAVSFLIHIKNNLEDPARMLLDLS